MLVFVVSFESLTKIFKTSHTLFMLCVTDTKSDVDVDVLSLYSVSQKGPDNVWCINSLCFKNPITIFQSANRNASDGPSSAADAVPCLGYVLVK